MLEERETKWKREVEAGAEEKWVGLRQLNGDVLIVYGERCRGKRLLES